VEVAGLLWGEEWELRMGQTKLVALQMEPLMILEVVVVAGNQLKKTGHPHQN